MFEICVTTYCGVKKVIDVVDNSLMRDYVNRFMKCVDTASVVVIDGLTGEVLFEFGE